MELGRFFADIVSIDGHANQVHLKQNKGSNNQLNSFSVHSEEKSIEQSIPDGKWLLLDTAKSGEGGLGSSGRSRNQPSRRRNNRLFCRRN